MENVKMHLEGSQTEQNDFEIQEYDEEKKKKQQKEIEEMKQEDSEDREQKIQKLMNLLNENPEIDQWVIDLFNQLKKEKIEKNFYKILLKIIWKAFEPLMIQKW